MESRKMFGTTVNFVNLTLNSQGICFLCLRDINFVNDFVLDKPLSIVTEFKLTSISRFLKLDIEKVVPTKDSNKSKSKRGDLAVSLCQECALIAKKFNALHQTLELTKIRLTECVKRIHELMTEAENDCDRVEEMMERMTDLGVSRGDSFDAPHATIIENLRKEIIMKCEINVKSAKPRVQLKRLTWEKYNKEQVQMDSPSIVKLDPEPQPQAAVLHQLKPSFENPGSCTPSSMGVATPVYEDGGDNDDEQESSIYERENKNPLKKPSLNSSPPKSHFQGGFPHHSEGPCPCCPAVLSSSVKLNDHIIRFHLEQYFLDLKDPSVSPDQFTKLANHLLFKDQEDQEASYAEAGTATCPYCSQKYLYNYFRKLVNLKVHMVKTHRQSLAEKVIEIQKDPNFREKLELAVSQSDGFTCSCGLYISSRTKFKYHDLYSCPNGKKGGRFKSNAKNSMKKRDHANLPLPVRPISGSELSSGKNQTLKKKRKRIRIRIKKSCPTCGAILADSCGLKGHHIRFHRENFFGSCRDPSISPDKFMKLVNHLLFKDQDDLDELQDDGNRTISCPYCDKQFVSQANGNKKVVPLINHMINSHRQHLVDKLAELQKDPSLNEKLELAIAEAGGETCSCGSYVSTRYKLIVHKKHYCSKTRTKSCIRAARFVCTVKMENPQNSHRRIRCHKCGLLVHSLGIRGHLKICGQQIAPSSCNPPYTFDSSTSGIKIKGEKEKSSDIFPEISIISSETLQGGFQDQEMKEVLVDPLADVTLSTDYRSSDELSAMSSFVKLEEYDKKCEIENNVFKLSN